MADVRIGCRSCGKKVLMDVMKYDPNNRKNLICPECFNHKIEQKDMNSRTKRVLLSLKEPKEGDSSYTEYKCHNCGYAFRRKVISQQKLCPNCGKKTVVQKQKVGMDWTKAI